MRCVIDFSSTLSKVLIFALLGWVVCQPDSAIAKIYKYKDENGKTHFTDDASKIPLRYRNQGNVKKFKGVNEPEPGISKGNRGQVDAGTGESDDQEDEGLSAKDVVLVNKTIQVFKGGVALGNQYKKAYPRFATGQGAVKAIQSALPKKEGLANELAGTKVPELKQALGFLKKSIAVDKQTTSVGQGLNTRIAGIFNRLSSEGEQQAALIKKLEQALKDSKKKKADAAKKKEEESKMKK